MASSSRPGGTVRGSVEIDQGLGVRGASSRQCKVFEEEWLEGQKQELMSLRAFVGDRRSLCQRESLKLALEQLGAGIWLPRFRPR